MWRSSQHDVGVYQHFCQLAMAFLVVRVCVTVVGLVQSCFLCTRVSGYCCNLCVCRYMWSEFYCAQWLGHLDQFLECFSVFSHPPLPFIIIITLLLLSLLLLLLLVITVIIISTELLALCDGCLGWGQVRRAGLVAGLWVGSLYYMYYMVHCSY